MEYTILFGPCPPLRRAPTLIQADFKKIFCSKIMQIILEFLIFRLFLTVCIFFTMNKTHKTFQKILQVHFVFTKIITDNRQRFQTIDIKPSFYIFESENFLLSVISERVLLKYYNLS